MVGSKKWFLYTTDSSDNFAMEMDESNGIAVSNTDMTDANVEDYSVPGNVRKRFAMYRSAAGTTARKIYVSTVAKLAAVPATITIKDADGTDLELSLSYKRGEVVFLPKAADSGLNDGTAT